MYVKAYQDLSIFFCCERLSASMAQSLHLSVICIRLAPWTFFGPCTWEPGRGGSWLPWRAAPLCCVVVLVWFARDFRWILRFTFSPAQWASLQLNGPVQLFSDQDSWLTGPYWLEGRRRKKMQEDNTRWCHTNIEYCTNDKMQQRNWERTCMDFELSLETPLPLGTLTQSSTNLSLEVRATWNNLLITVIYLFER